jgi:hypothetical protein
MPTSIDLTEGLPLDEPAASVPWSLRRGLVSAILAPALVRLREPPRPLFGDEWTALVRVFGARWRLVLDLAPAAIGGRLRGVWLEPPPEAAFGSFQGEPEALAEQIAKHGAAILARRATLEGALGAPSLEPKRPDALPCATAVWSITRATVRHEINWNVERDGDEGWLQDRVRITPGA